MGPLMVRETNVSVLCCCLTSVRLIMLTVMTVMA